MRELTPGQQRIAKAMSEAELQDAIIGCARTFSYTVAHFRPALTKHGWRTPVAADGKGFPDLLLAKERPADLIAVELKREGQDPTPDQIKWLRVLAPSIPVFIWRPSNWLAGEVEQVFRIGITR